MATSERPFSYVQNSSQPYIKSTTSLSIRNNTAVSNKSSTEAIVGGTPLSKVNQKYSSSNLVTPDSGFDTNQYHNSNNHSPDGRMTDLRRSTGSMDRMMRNTDNNLTDSNLNLNGVRNSRKELHSLNEKLASQLEKIRFLTAENAKLYDELNRYKASYGRETERIRQLYDHELKQLRGQIDEAERQKSESLAKTSSLQQANRDLKEELLYLKKNTEKLSLDLESTLSELTKRDGENQNLIRRIQNLEDQLNKMRSSHEKLLVDNKAMSRSLDDETAIRMTAQSEMQTLREELDFLRRINSEQVKEMQILQTEAQPAHETWQNEFSKAVRDIQMDYDKKLKEMEQEFENQFTNKLRNLKSLPSSERQELVNLRQENEDHKLFIEKLRMQLSRLQMRNEQLEGTIRETTDELEDLRRRFDSDMSDCIAERKNLEEGLDRVHKEMEELINTKLSLEAEISAYRHLLDAQDGIMKNLRSSPAPSKPSDNYQNNENHRSNSVQFKNNFQAKSGTIRSAPRNAPNFSPTNNMSQFEKDRPDARARRVFENESSPTRNGNRGHEFETESATRPIKTELTAKSQFDYSFKGPISIDDCSPDGRYVQITNTSSSPQQLHGFRIVRNVEHGKQLIRFTFDDFTISPNTSIRIWARGQNSSNNQLNDLESPYSTWGVGNFVQTTLFNKDGEERANHCQRSVLIQ